MAKYVIGNFTSPAQAEEMINNLIQEENYPADSISVMGNDTAVSSLRGMGVAVDSDFDYDADDESLWERIKHFFGADDHEDYGTVLSGHREDIRNGNVLVVVDDTLVPDSLRESLRSRDTGYWTADRSVEAGHNLNVDRNLTDLDDETVRLQEERLNVDKESVEAGEVVLKKRVVESNETINVPVRHEEVVVERRPVTDRIAGDADFDDETITIPLHEERVHVTKEPVVVEEVHVRKSDVQDTKQVSASVRKEELDVEKQGNVVIRDNEPTPPPV